MKNKHISNLEYSEYGASLELTAEQEKKCKVVYKLSENNPDVYVFNSLWNPDLDYGEEYIIVPLRSTAYGTTEKDAGHIFSNILDSTDDPHPKINPATSSWLDLFRNENIPCDKCCTDGHFYNPINDMPFTESETGKQLKCNNFMKGGHVFEGKDNKKFKKNDKQTVELIPICSHHNSYTLGTGSVNGAGFYMKLKAKMKIILLYNYLSKTTVNAAEAKQ